MLDKLNIGKLFGNSAPTSEPVQQDIVGIDISHSYVRTIGLKKKNKKWSLHKISTKVLDESYENDEKRNEAIVNLLKTIKLEQKFETENAAISLPVNAAIVQVIQIPYLDEKELKEKIIKFRGDELHHQEIAYDNGATKKGLFGVLDKVIKTSSRIAITISEKI